MKTLEGDSNKISSLNNDSTNVKKYDLVLDKKHLETYKGLKSIGPEIAGFFLDGIEIFKENNLETKSYLLAHIA